MRPACLHLLGDRVHVAEPPLEGMALEDRGGSGRVVGEIADGDRLLEEFCEAASRSAMRWSIESLLDRSTDCQTSPSVPRRYMRAARSLASASAISVWVTALKRSACL